MAPQAIFRLLEQYPQLRPFIEEGRFLMGYTNGSANGRQVPVFLLRSPWTQFCIQATACDVLIPGAVLVITDDPQWSLESNWKAYSLAAHNSPLASRRRNVRPIRRTSPNPVSPLTVMAAEIATEEAVKRSSVPAMS